MHRPGDTPRKQQETPRRHLGGTQGTRDARVLVEGGWNNRMSEGGWGNVWDTGMHCGPVCFPGHSRKKHLDLYRCTPPTWFLQWQ